MLLTHSAIAAGPAVKNQFTSGQKAVASEVNENFQELADRIQTNTDNITANTSAIGDNTTAISNNTTAIGDNTTAIGNNTTEISNLSNTVNQMAPTTYDFHNFGRASNLTSVTFEISGSGMAASGCNTETRTFQRTPLGNGVTNVDIMRTRTQSGGAVCHYNVLHYQSRADGFYWMGRDVYDNLQNFVSSNVINGGLIERGSNMEIGKSFGGASSTSIDTTNTNTTSTVVSNLVLLGLEDVSVPAGDYTGCLKISRNIVSGDSSFGSNQSVAWYCSGVGLTKRIDSVGNIWTLSSITTN